jgi:DNA-binding response OmpR family regulator
MTPPPDSAHDPRVPSAAGSTILVVEDDPRIVELLHIALGAHGFRVLSAQNGDDAWRLLLDEQPDLVILDVRLPRRSGLDLCDSIRREPAIAHLPVIMVSALAETESRLAGLARGADDYLPKPFSPKELVARVRRLLARGEQSRELLRRSHELAAEVDRSRSDLRRLNQELRKELSVKEAFVALAQDLASARRVEEVAGTFLRSLTSHLGVAAGVLLVPDEAGDLAPAPARGVTSDALASLCLPGSGELARLVGGLARAVRRDELARFPELRDEIGPLVAVGAALVVPLETRGRLVGMAVLPERADGADYAPADLEMAHSLARAGATALDNARVLQSAEETYLRALAALVPAIEAHDPDLGRRARGVSDLAAALAGELGLDPTVRQELRLDALARVVSPWTPAERAGIEPEILRVAEAYFAFLEGAAPGRPAADDVARFFGAAHSGRGFDRQVTQALDDLLRRGPAPGGDADRPEAYTRRIARATG